MSAMHPLLCHNAATGPCAVCGEPGLPCARCRVDYYCGKEHQKQHWPQHKPGCGSIELRDGVVVATKDIPAGTVIMRELPTLTFPSSPFTYQQLDIKWMCVGCNSNMTSLYQCLRCGLSVCDDCCSQSPNHQVECQVLQRANFKVRMADLKGTRGSFFGVVVATLRIAAAFPQNPLLQHLGRDSSLDIKAVGKMPGAVGRKESNRVEADFAVSYLLRTAGVKQFSESELKRAARISFMYGDEIVGPSPDRWFDVPKQRFGRHLYLGMQLRKHSCFPNSGDRVTSPKTAEYVVVTSRDISVGECVTKIHQGCDWLDETLQRRHAVMIRWGFFCDCERCRDPTELGMYVGSPCCPTCGKRKQRSYLVPTDKDHSRWRCEGCRKTMNVDQVKALTSQAEERLDRLHGSSPKRLLKFIADHVYPRGPLHPTHALVLRAKDYIREDIYERRADLDVNDMEGELELDQWETVLRDLLRAMDRLLPGSNDGRVLTLLGLRRLVLWRVKGFGFRHSASFEFMAQFPLLFADAVDPIIHEHMAAVKEVNKELCRHHFNRDEDEPKRSLIKDPFGGY